MRRWVLLYDASCGVCKWLLALLLRWDRAERLRPLALQRPEAEQLLAELTPQQRVASWHLLSPAGTRVSAGEAAAPLLSLLPGGRLPAAVLASLPRQAEWGYAFLAAHRSALSKLLPERAKRRAGEQVRARETAPRRC